MSKIKNSGLHQYGAEPFKQQQFGAAGVEGVNEALIEGQHWHRQLTYQDAAKSVVSSRYAAWANEPVDEQAHQPTM